MLLFIMLILQKEKTIAAVIEEKNYKKNTPQLTQILSRPRQLEHMWKHM